MKPFPVLTALAAVSVVSAVVALRPGALVAAVAGASLALPPATNGAAHPADGRGIRHRAQVPGDFRRSSVDRRAFVTSDGAKPSASAPPTLRLKGSWLETVAETDARRTTLIVAFTPEEVAPRTLSRDDLARPFVVELDPVGRVSTVAFAPGVTGDARQALRALVAEAQLTSGADPSARTWRVDEEDTTGQYHASYSVTSPTEVVRRKEGYARVLSDRGLLPPAPGVAYEVDSVTRYGLDLLGAPLRIALRESVRITTGKDTPALGALALLDVELTETGHGPVPAVSVGPSERLATLTARPGSEAARDAQLAHGADFPTLVARLADIERLAPEEQRRAAARALPQARAVLRLDPKAAVEAARAVADRSTAPITATLLGAALAAAGTDEARGALLQLAREGDADARLLGVRALTQAQSGDAETLGTLQSLLGDADPGVATAASLALGANVRGPGGADDAKASAIGALTSMYEDAPDDATQRTAVLALGNAGGRDALPALLDALGESAPIAEAAVYGLRYVPGDDVDQVLDGILRQGSPGQRLAAVNAVMERDHGGWAPKLAALLDGDLPQQVRQAIVAALR